MTNSTRFQFFIARRLYAATAKLLAACAVLLLFGLPARAELVDLNTGTSTYSIPIVTPPGTNGMGPNLSLQYSSGGDNGWIGDGWSLQGLGYIERRGPGYGPSASYVDSRDTFVLNHNGSRKLISTGADPATGAAGKFYRTEIDSHLKIQLIGGRADPDYRWEVTDKAGTKYYFGQLELSRQTKKPVPYTHRWYLDQVTDIHGVSWRVNYTKPYSNGTSAGMYPSSITYSTVGSVPCATLTSCPDVLGICF